MKFGLQFFPSVRPEYVSADAYFRDLLDVVELGERLGFDHARLVEHYFHHYGGYSPNPLLFLAAASQRITRMPLITGAVLPVFNPPGRSTLDLFGNGFSLLALSDVPATPLSDALQQQEVPFTLHHIVNGEAVSLYAAPHVLVRPDGHVAWRGDARDYIADDVVKTIRGAGTLQGSASRSTDDVAIPGGWIPPNHDG